VIWGGGRLRLQVLSGVAAEDRLEVWSSGEGPGQIGVSWNPGPPENGGVRFGGVEFATVQRVSAAELVFNIESSATTVAVEALLRQVLYTNTVFSADAFTGPSVSFPTRAVQFSLTDGAGNSAIVNRQIEFPALTGLYLNPSSVTVLFDWSCLACRPYAVGSADVVVMGTFSATVGWQPLSFWRTTWSDDCGGHWWALRQPGKISVLIPFPYLGGEFRCTITADVGSGRRLSMPLQFAAQPDCPFATLLRILTCHAFPWLCPGGPHVAPKSPDPEPPPIFSLAAFRALESLMNQSDEGRRLVSLYWRHGAEMVYILQTQTNVVLQLGSVVTNFQPLVVALLSGQGQQAQVTQAMIDQLNLAYHTMTNYASPELRAAMDTERARFNGFQDFVGKDFSQWAQMLLIPAPTNAWIYISGVGLTNGQFTAEANAVDGWNVSLWRASDLTPKSWEPVPGAKIETNGYTLRLTDTNAAPPRRFYQLRAQPENLKRPAPNNPGQPP
jgi:hypothetical protein